MVKITVNQIPLDLSVDKFAEFKVSNELLHQSAKLQERMKEDGYLFVRSLIDKEDILNARREILQKFSILGEIDENYPLMDAIDSGISYKTEVNYRAFYQSVRMGACYQKIARHPKLIHFYEKLLGKPVKPFDYMWVRLIKPGEGAGVHYDAIYFQGGANPANIYSCWIPIGNVNKEEGAFLVKEGGHKIKELIKEYAQKDYTENDNGGWIKMHPNEIQKNFGGRWLSANFRAGDIIIFSMYTLHGSLDNNSPKKKLRLSTDLRYQLASKKFDPIWMGHHPVTRGRNKVWCPGKLVSKSTGNANLDYELKDVNELGKLIVN